MSMATLAVHLGRGSVHVSYRARLQIPSGARRLVLQPRGRRIRDVACTSAGPTRPDVIRVGSRVLAVIDIASAGDSAKASEQYVALEYAFQAEEVRWRGDARVWRTDARCVPTVFVTSGKIGGPFRKIEPAVEDDMLLSVSCDPGVVAFGPPRVLATQGISLSRFEVRRLEILFGAFVSSPAVSGPSVWVPTSEARVWSDRDLVTVRDAVVDASAFMSTLLGESPDALPDVIVKPRRTGSAYQFGHAIVIRDPRTGRFEWDRASRPELLAQLAHELSHSWWQPLSQRYRDPLLPSLGEGAAVLAEHLILYNSVEDPSTKSALESRLLRDTDLLTRLFSVVKRQYPGALSGPRIGHVLLTFARVNGPDFLAAVQRLYLDLRDKTPPPNLTTAVASHLGIGVARALSVAAHHPKAPVASVRIDRSSVGDTVVLAFGTRPQAFQTAQLLTESGVLDGRMGAVSVDGRRVRMTVTGQLPTTSLIPALSPGFFALRSDVQFSRAWSNGVFRQVANAASLLRDESSPGHRRVRKALIGLVEVVIESEAAIGFNLLADAVTGLVPGVEERLRRVAATRLV